MLQDRGSRDTVTLTSQRSIEEGSSSSHHAIDMTVCKDGQDLEKGKPGEQSEKVGDDQQHHTEPATKREKGPQQDQNHHLITFDGPQDPGNPTEWSRHYKCMITFILAGMTFVTTFTSSIFSTAIDATAEEFHMSTEVMTLGTSLFLLGFTLGPIIWGPISELYGRRPPLIIGTGGMACFQVGVAVAQNVYTIMICRFFAGVLGVAPLCVVGGALSDFWNPVQRGVSVGIYAMCTFIGPVAAPIMGGYITESYLGWRWTQYISVIMALLFWAIAAVALPETSHSRILQSRAKKIRLQTHNWALHAEADEKEINMKIITERYLTRPFRMMWQEPILCLLAL
ncbi:MAG: hypothetical protein Q9163_003868 [Psora crenata]